MILSLAIRLFFYNSKRSYRASQLLALSLIAISSTSILISAFASEVNIITSLLNKDNNVAMISVEGEFQDNQIKKLNKIASSPYVDKLSFMTKLSGNVSVNVNTTFEVPIFLANLTHFLKGLVSKQSRSTLANNSAIISSNFANFLQVDNLYSLGINQSIYPVFIEETVSLVNEEVQSGIIADYKLTDINYQPNLAVFRVRNAESLSSLVSELDSLGWGEIETNNGEELFLKYSASDIIDTLVLLLLMISIMAYFSISNIIIMIIKESKQDIKIMRSVGYGQYQLIVIFLLIAFFIGLLGSILSIFVSILLTNLIISMIAVLASLPYVPTALTATNIILNVIPGILLAVISSLYPIYAELDIS